MQQNIQTELNFPSTSAGEAREAGREETESFSTVNDPESPASTNRLMEEICERENLKEALRRVKANKGSPGVDGMTVIGIKDYLKQHWPAIREQLLNGTYEPKPVDQRRRCMVNLVQDKADLWSVPLATGRNRQAGRRRDAKAWHPNGAGPSDPAGGDAGSAEAVGPDVFRLQLRVPAGAVGSAGSGTSAAVYRRRPRLVR